MSPSSSFLYHPFFKVTGSGTVLDPTISFSLYSFSKVLSRCSASASAMT